MSKIKSYKEWEQAYEQAKLQRDNHENMVSGVWSISGKEFCDKLGLDYSQAEQAQLDQDTDDFQEFLDERYSRIVSLIGELTSEQYDRLYEITENEYEFGGERYHFWNNLMEQLEQNHRDYSNHYWAEKQ